METAGRTIVFSGLTVALALAALLVFPLYFLRSFAYAGIAVVAFAVLGALFVMPALLDVFSNRLARKAEKAAKSTAHTERALLETSSLGGHQPARAQRLPRVGGIAHHRLTVPARSFLQS